MNYEQRVIIQFLHKETIHPTQIHRRLAVQHGLEIYSLRSVQHWCQLFDCGRQNLHNNPRSGRPPINHPDTKIVACLEREPFASAYSLAEALDVLPATVCKIRCERKCSSPLGPTPVDRRPAAGDSRKMWWASSRAGSYAASPFSPHYHIANDESWFFLEYQHAPQWSFSRDEVPQRVSVSIGIAQFIFTAIWGVNDFHLLNLMPSQCRLMHNTLWSMLWRP
jgi:hypothetical protein